MSATEVREQLVAIIADRDVAGITFTSEFRSGGLTVMPPAGQLSKAGPESSLGLFRTADGKQAVAIDVAASQANRMEAALKSVAEEISYPLFVVKGVERVGGRDTSLDWPHRQADAHWRLLQGQAIEAGYLTDDDVQELHDATILDAEPLLRWFPASVLFGWWHSVPEKLGGKPAKEDKAVLDALLDSRSSVNANTLAARSARVVTSEIFALGVSFVPRLSTRIDPFGALPGGTKAKDGVEAKKSAYSQGGLGTIPPTKSNPSVTYESIAGTTFIGLSHLRHFAFGEHTLEGGVLALALALLAIGEARYDLHLRSGADLVLTGEPVCTLDRGSGPVPFPVPSREDLIALVSDCGTSTFGWSGSLPLAPSETYLQFAAVAAKHQADAGEQ